jgi:hypothetical protein
LVRAVINLYYRRYITGHQDEMDALRKKQKQKVHLPLSIYCLNTMFVGGGIEAEDEILCRSEFD